LVKKIREEERGKQKKRKERREEENKEDRNRKMSSPSYVFNICETPVLWATQEV
jgi:hypothetical protein